MQEDDNTSKEPRNLELENRPLYFKFLVGGRRDDEVRADEHYAAAKRAMFYLSALLWLMQQLSPSHLELENNGDVAAQINYASELGDLLEGLAHQHLEMLERERERLAKSIESEPKLIVIPGGEKLDKIANIIIKTRAHKGDAAEIADDQAVMMISDLLLTKGGASNE